MVIDARGVPLARWPALLERLVRESVRERRAGLVPALSQTSARYRRELAGVERWQSARESYLSGEPTDCEDLAIWLCADLRVAGIPAVVVFRKTAPGMRHALVLARAGGRAGLFDPSKARGMKGAA